MNVLVFFLMLLLQAPEVSLHGVVLKTGTDEPIARASVELRPTDGVDARVRTVTTANTGSSLLPECPVDSIN
jgi:hypothetical protein